MARPSSSRPAPFRSILCPVDFSRHAREALRTAARLARPSHGRLVVLFVNDPLLLAAAAAAMHRRREFLRRTAAELQRFVVRSLGPSEAALLSPECLVSVGDPGDEILRAARRLGSDLVVIGTHGLSGVDKLFFGSTTEHVLRGASLPVLAIPPAAVRRRGRDAVALSCARIVAPIDLTGDWAPDAAHAAAVARALDAELLLVHVVPDGPLPQWFRARRSASRRRRMARAERLLARLGVRLFPDVRTVSRVASGDPAREIARLAAEGPSSLVVMSLRGTRGLWRARRGSIAYRVLTRAARPVLALPRRRLGARLSRRVAHAIARQLSRRDQIEMAGIDALLSVAGGRLASRSGRSATR